MSSHHDTIDQQQNESGSFLKLLFTIIGVAFAVFSLVSGVALIYGAYVLHSGGEITPPARSQPTEAQIAAAVAAAPAADTTAASTVTEILIKPDTANPLAFDLKTFSVKAGQPVKLTFENKSALPQPHNWILGKIGSKDTLIAAANAMVTDPNGMAKGYLPDIPEVLAHTKLLNPGDTGTAEFTAPTEPGEYPYICSFPGHAAIMNGFMIVE